MRSEIRNTNGSVLVLLGAGASIDAGVLHTSRMISDINNMLANNPEWVKYRPIYKHLKNLYGKEYSSEDGSIAHGDLNIEQLVGNLTELLLLLNGEHILYPFFKSWIDLFQNLYGFEDVKNFRSKIEDKLKEWIVPDQLKLDYFRQLLVFAKENSGSGLRVFTLNYDKCVEGAFQEHDDITGLLLERGFGKEKQNATWNTRNFDEKNDVDSQPNAEKSKYIFLYKMHGSIDWDRNDKQELIKTNNLSIRELIFGTQQKVKAHDPYLYYVYQFRTSTLNAKLIIVCGYSFFDDYINRILHQSLLSNPDQKILICDYFEDADLPLNEGREKERYSFYSDILQPQNQEQIKLWFGKAPAFFESLSMDNLEMLFPPDPEEELFFTNTSSEEV